MAEVPQVLWDYINGAYPDNTCLVATALPNGYAQVSPRGSVLVFDKDHIAFWDRGHGTTHDTVQTGTKVTIYFRHPQLRVDGILPGGGIARFYGTATVYPDGQMREDVWDKVVQVEKDRDPEKKGTGVVVKIERAEDLSGKPLAL